MDIIKIQWKERGIWLIDVNKWRKSTQEKIVQGTLLSLVFLNIIYPKKIRVTFSEQNRPPSKYLSKIENNNTNLNLKIASYFLNISDSPSALTWFTTGGPITKTIKKNGLTKHH